MGHLTEQKLKRKIDEMELNISERLNRLEKFMEEASKPRENEPAENKVKKEINKAKEHVEEVVK